MEEWKSESASVVNPQDSIVYQVPSEAILLTEKVLVKYGTGKNRSEGLLYWAGTMNGNTLSVESVIYPKLEASTYSCEVSPESNLKVVEVLAENDQVQIAQVHSHPFHWVGHSFTDDEKAAFKVEGLLSLVVPNFGKQGMMPLTVCGVHRFSKYKFVRLDNLYVQDHFKIIKGGKCKLYDLRRQ